MSNIPVKPIQPRDGVAKAGDPVAPQVEHEKGPVGVSDDALKVSVPRTQAKGASTNDPGPALESLLRGLRSTEDAGAAHGGLDAARVFGLLGDDDGDSSK